MRADRKIVTVFEKVSQTFRDRDTLLRQLIVSRSAISFCLSAVSRCRSNDDCEVFGSAVSIATTLSASSSYF